MKKIISVILTLAAAVSMAVLPASYDSAVKDSDVAVAATKSVEMKDLKINVKTSRKITLENPYSKNYTLKYDKSIIKLEQVLYSKGKEAHRLTGLKKGTTTVKAVIKGKVYGSFKVTVGDFKAGIKKNYSNSTIKFNKHIKSYNLVESGSVDLGKAVKYFHMDAEYTVKIKDTAIASYRKLKKTNNLPKRVEIYSLKPGKTTVTVYEKRGSAAKQNIGTIALTVKKAKDSEVVNANMSNDNDGLFYEFYISPGDKVDLKSLIVKNYINGSLTSKKYKDSEYTITFKAGPADTLTVNKNGKVTCLGVGNGENYVSYKITFADGSKVSQSGSFDITDE